MFRFAHNNINVTDLNRSLSFYKQALDLNEKSRIEVSDGSYVIVYLGDAFSSTHLLELTWLRDWEGTYDLGDNEFHLAFTTSEYLSAHARHQVMGCICFENEEMGIYFIEDPDGYWMEVLPEHK